MNGPVERLNKTLVERVRCMFTKTKIPKHFLGRHCL